MGKRDRRSHESDKSQEMENHKNSKKRHRQEHDESHHHRHRNGLKEEQRDPQDREQRGREQDTARHHRDRNDTSNVRIKQERDRSHDRDTESRRKEDRRRNERLRDEFSEVDIKPDVRRIKQERAENDERRRRDRARRPENPFETTDLPEFSGGNNDNENEPKEKEKPNFETSGALTEDTNTFRGVVIKYNEPSEARKPKRKWRFYIFKGEKELPVLHVHRQSAYLLGRDRKIADIPVDHPSCSKQHAVLQYRLVGYQREDGTKGRRVRPYIIDLDSANGTFLNNKKMDPQRYYELQEKDVVKFGFSSRDYVLLHDKSAGDEDEDESVGQQ